MAITIAITGRKGGVGKTTVAANLAVELSKLGHTVRVLDADPQRSLLNWAGLGEGLLSKLSHPADSAHPAAFREAIQTAQASADLVLIDTPPAFSDPALLALLVSDVALLPAGPSPLDLMAARDALAMVIGARAQRKSDRPIARFIPSKLVSRASLSNDLPASLEALGAPCLPGIGARTAVAESALSGLTVAEYAPHSKARAEFQALAAAVEALIKTIKRSKR